MKKQLLFSLTKQDFKVEFFCAGGHGGQNMQKNATACRISHAPSKSNGISRDERSQLQNKKLAFQRLINSLEFQKWFKIQCAKALGNHIDIDKWIDEQMDLSKLKFETKVNGKWTTINPINIQDIDYDDLED